MVLDAWEQLLKEHPRPDHRLRLEHVGAMRPDQFVRAAELGVTVSIFIDHLHYWGDVLVDDLFGPEYGSVWAAAGSALAAGQRFTFHNDGPVTPANPLRNMQDAVTRLSPSGRVVAPQERIPVDAAVRAHTVNAAWQLFSEDHIGSIFPGRLRGSCCAVGKSPRRRADQAGRHHGARHHPGGPDGVRRPERDRLIGRRTPWTKAVNPLCSISKDRCETGDGASGLRVQCGCRQRPEQSHVSPRP